MLASFDFKRTYGRSKPIVSKPRNNVITMPVSAPMTDIDLSASSEDGISACEDDDEIDHSCRDDASIIEQILPETIECASSSRSELTKSVTNAGDRKLVRGRSNSAIFGGSTQTADRNAFSQCNEDMSSLLSRSCRSISRRKSVASDAYDSESSRTSSQTMIRFDYNDKSTHTFYNRTKVLSSSPCPPTSYIAGDTTDFCRGTLSVTPKINLTGTEDSLFMGSSCS